MLCCHCNPLYFSPFKNLPTTDKWTTKFWQQNSKLLSFFSDLVFMWGRFSCVCNWPFCAERRCDLVAQVLAWNQQNMGSLPAGFPAIAPKKWQPQNQKVMTLNAEKMRIEINLLIFDTTVSFNAYLNALVTRRGVCAMLVARLCQVRALVFKSSFNLFWKSVSCRTKSNHAALCTNGLVNSSVSFHREMLLAFTLPSSCGRCSRRSSLLLPADHAWKTTLFSPSPHLKLVFQWFADASLASHINSNSMTRCLVHFSRHTLQS